ncbi:methyl-accepting chemotaxis protein [Orenia marismortui]|uniref:methyl-accepting chemotaxis protein n=1 Tax=Orenia marismortui TaxID=46469 RepID=UPI000362BBAD|nr:methyl-accepting chemotaxis protein [Orenia marismortui]
MLNIFNWRDISIKWKIAVLLLIVTIVPLLITGFFIQVNNYNKLRESLLQQGSTNLKVVKDSLKAQEDKLAEISNRVLENQELVNAIKREDAEMLYVQLNKIMKNESLDFLTFLLPDGRVVRRGNNPSNYKDKLPFNKIISHTKETQGSFVTYKKYPIDLLKKEDNVGNNLSNRIVSTANQEDALTIMGVLPVRFLDRLVGFFIMGDILNNNPNIYNQRLENLVFANETSKNNDFSGIKMDGSYIIASQEHWSPEKGLVNVEIKELTEEHLLFEDQIKGINGENLATLSYAIPKLRLEASKRESLWITIKIIVIVIMAVALISILLSLKVGQKIDVIIDKLKQIANGDLRTRLEVKGKDELGEVALEFNQTIAAQANILKKILAMIDDISSYSEELSASSEEGNAVTETATDRINDLAAGIRQIADSSQEVANYSQQAHDKTEVGERMIKEVVTKTEEIVNAVEEAKNTINSLDDTSQEVGGIVNLITEIAEQTNLLALNASIEAARAGEYGHGFAVVAEEIKELSDDTRKAADKAITLIKETQNKSKEGLLAVEQVNKEARAGRELIEETGQSFKEIAEVVEDTSAYIQETTASTEELSSNSEEISRATEDMKGMSEEVTKSSEELATMALELKELVNRYNL